LKVKRNGREWARNGVPNLDSHLIVKHKQITREGAGMAVTGIFDPRVYPPKSTNEEFIVKALLSRLDRQFFSALYWDG